MWDALLDDYVDALARGGRRPHTVRGYRGDLAGLVQALDATGRTRAQVDGALRRWAQALEPLAPATQARRRSAARGFLGWAAAAGVRVPSAAGLDPAAAPGAAAPGAPAAGPERRSVHAPEPADVADALAAIPLQADRDQLLFKLMARAGLRPGEVLALRMGDFAAAAEQLRVEGWGGRHRTVLVDDPELALRLTHWVRTTAGTGATGAERPMFAAPGREAPLRYQSVAERWDRYIAAAGVTVRLGDLRLHHAAQLLAGGVPEWAVRQRLGQPTGPLPLPRAASADDEIRAWQQRRAAAHPPPPPRQHGRSAG